MLRPSLILFAAACMAFAGPVSLEEAQGAFQSVLSARIIEAEGGEALAYLFTFNEGYVVTSTVTGLPPVIAYSKVDRPGEHLIDLVRRDLSSRLSLIGQESDGCEAEWEEFLSGGAFPQPLQQWPPEGTTPTGGWLMENWTQNSPYNTYCPMDLIAGSRSVAGCPAVAMGSILNFHECTNGTRFDDDDDYYHNYHEYYWIDDDHENHDFPSWPELNVLMDTLEAHYALGQITQADKGAIVYASGAACKQVYTASVSGTFGVTQAYNAYLKFGFTDCQLLYENADSLLEKMAQNMMDARPIHLAIIDDVPQYGHNVVVDGYNTDGFFHINFGWGGSSNGWYSFPLSGMPYGMNLIEGVVLDIIPPVQSAEGTGGNDSFISLEPLANPVGSQAMFSVTVPESGQTEIRLYSLAGRMAAAVLNQVPAGVSTCAVDAAGLETGIYLAVLRYGSGQDTAMVTILGD